jgi:nicotinamidase-related amidase
MAGYPQSGVSICPVSGRRRLAGEQARACWCSEQSCASFWRRTVEIDYLEEVLMLMRADRSVLLLVDLQERLQPAIHDAPLVLEASIWLTRVAQRLEIPVICTEQYPKGLGLTMSPLRDLLPDECIVEKICFSAVPEEVLFQAPGGDRAQFIVAGTEAHVCVQQTVLDLLAAGRRVFVVEEAVGSRRSGDKALALERMRGHGADIVSREMVVFEWLRQAGSDLFREISRDFIR